MNKYLILLSFCLLILIGNPLEAQEVQVVDKNSGEPIPKVFIYNQNGSISTNTNESGYFNIDLFQKDNLISFQHPSYQTATFSWRAVSLKARVELNENIFQVDEIVISANKWEQNIAEIPQKITTIDRREIEFRNPQTSADLLESTGKIFVQKSQLAGGSPMIRGFAANSVLIVIDGVRMNHAVFRSGNLQNILNIDPLAIEESEVIFGPGSVVYGSDALGGVMDFHTVDHRYDSGKVFSNEFFTRFSSANFEKTFHWTGRLNKNKWSVLNIFSYSDFDDLRSGSNYYDDFPDFGKRNFYVERIQGKDSVLSNPRPEIQVGSAFSQWSNIFKVGYRIDEEREIKYGFYYSTSSQLPRYDRLIQLKNNGEDPRSAEWNYGPQKWARNSLTYSSSKKNILWDEQNLIFAQQSFEESRITRSFDSSIRSNRRENITAFNLLADMNKIIGEKTRLFYGLELQYNKVESNAFAVDIESNDLLNESTRYPNGGSDFRTAAAYLTSKSKLKNNLYLHSGLRYTWVLVRANFEPNEFYDFPFDQFRINDDNFTGNIGLVWYPGELLKISLIGSSGFRAPNIDDAGKLFDSEPGNVIVPNSNLSSEYTYNIDVGLNKKFKNGNLNLSFFHTWVDDLIVRRNGTFLGSDSIVYDGVKSRVQTLTNADSGVIYGFSIDGAWDISYKWKISSSLTYTEGQDNEGLPLRHVAPLFGQTALQFKASDWRLELFSRYNGAIPFEELSPSEQNKAYLYTADGSLAWFTLNFRAKWSISKMWDLTASVENILDKHYRTYSSGISAPGINFIGGLRLKL